MPLRPELPAGLNLSRRITTPVKLPKMTFPMADDYADQPGAAGPSAADAQMAAAAPQASMARLALFQQQQAQMPEQPAPAPAYERPAQAATYERPAQAPAQAAQAAPAVPTVPAAQAHQIIIYGRAGCAASIAAIQDLIDREMSFTYFDVGRDAGAMAHLQAICGNAPMVPVIIQIGFAGI
ncbi:MAG: hypothetical protein JWN15_4410 [Firmicutes bacterium]|nr:hypothetical protein [Bacillota bacterium]